MWRMVNDERAEHIKDLEAQLSCANAASAVRDRQIADAKNAIADRDRQLSDIRSGLSFRIGRVITYIPRKAAGRS